MSGAGQVDCKIDLRIMPSDASLRLGKMRMGHCRWRYIWKEKVQSTFKVLHKVFFACHADHCWQLLFLSEDVRSTGSIWEWPPLDSDCGLSVWCPRERESSLGIWVGTSAQAREPPGRAIGGPLAMHKTSNSQAIHFFMLSSFFYKTTINVFLITKLEGTNQWKNRAGLYLISILVMRGSKVARIYAI